MYLIFMNLWLKYMFKYWNQFINFWDFNAYMVLFTVEKIKVGIIILNMSKLVKK